MAYTEDELRERIRTLEDGLLKVEKGVTFADRGVTYKTANELMPSLTYFRSLLVDMTIVTAPTRSKQTLGVSNKGF